MAEVISTPVADVSVAEVAAEMLGAGAMPVAVINPEAPVGVAEVDTPPTASSSTADLQQAAVEALTRAKSQGSAADALADAEWKADNGELRVQTELSKTMLPMVVNPEAEKIIRAALREAGAGALKLVLLPGAASATTAKKPRAAKSGSAQAKAMEHPVVQQAQRLFDAEIRNVIDLREGE